MIKYYLVQDGFLAGTGYCPDETLPVHPGFEVFEGDPPEGLGQKPAAPAPYYFWDTNTQQWVDGRTLQELKDAKYVEITEDRVAQSTMNVVALSKNWQADPLSQTLIGQSITLASAGLPLPNSWRDADNNDVLITSINDLLAIGGAMAAQVEAAYETSWSRKAAVDAATTKEEVEAA